jgi:hypothetical protein
VWLTVMVITTLQAIDKPDAPLEAAQTRGELAAST